MYKRVVSVGERRGASAKQIDYCALSDSREPAATHDADATALWAGCSHCGALSTQLAAICDHSNVIEHLKDNSVYNLI